jgi:hypothetical protein
MACDCECQMIKTIRSLVRRQRILEERILELELDLNEECGCK